MGLLSWAKGLWWFVSEGQFGELENAVDPDNPIPVPSSMTPIDPHYLEQEQALRELLLRLTVLLRETRTPNPRGTRSEFYQTCTAMFADELRKTSHPALKHDEYLPFVVPRFLDHVRNTLKPLPPAEADAVSDETLIETFIAKQPRSIVALVRRGDQVLSVSRRDRLVDLGLPGGKLDPWETPEIACARETKEEAGIILEEMHFIYERIDETDGRVCWCYEATKWSGTPRQREPGIIVEWVTPARLLEPSCTFAEYNRGLFKAMGI